MSIGWIKLHRKITESWVWSKDREFSKGQAWIDILINVNHREEKVLIGSEFYTVKPGESVRSIKTWADSWGWSRSKVRRFMDLLSLDGMVEFKTDTKTTHLKVCNWETYQEIIKTNGHQTDIKRTSNGHQTDTNKNEKNIKKDKKSIYSPLISDHESILKMDKPLTEEEGKILITEYGRESVEIVLLQMENWKPLVKKNKSAYLTAINWLKRNESKSSNKGTEEHARSVHDRFDAIDQD